VNPQPGHDRAAGNHKRRLYLHAREDRGRAWDREKGGSESTPQVEETAVYIDILQQVGLARPAGAGGDVGGVEADAIARLNKRQKSLQHLQRPCGAI